MTLAIEAQDIIKSYRVKNTPKNFLKGILFPRYSRIIAVNRVSINVKAGEIFGLLGTNGAGKTTLIKCLTGILSPDKGSVYLGGETIEEAQGKIGVMFSSKILYNRITGYDNLKFFARLYGVDDYEQRIETVSRLFGIEQQLEQLVETYSLGTKTRLAFARTLLHEPQILFLDEPTLGLDPYIGANIRKTIKELNKTILLTTHYMEEVEELCDRVGILDRGKIVAAGTPEQLKKIVRNHTTILVESSYLSVELQKELKKARFVLAFYKRAQGLRILIEHKNDLPKLLKILSHYKITKIQEHEPSLEDVFIKITGEHNDYQKNY